MRRSQGKPTLKTTDERKKTHGVASMVLCVRRVSILHVRIFHVGVWVSRNVRKKKKKPVVVPLGVRETKSRVCCACRGLTGVPTSG